MNTLKRSFVFVILLLITISIFIAQDNANSTDSSDYNKQDDGTVIEGIDNVLYPSGPVHNNLKTSFQSKLDQFNSSGYFSQIYESSLQATYYGLYILNALDELEIINTFKVVEYIMSNYNTSSHTFMDSYAYRYLDTDFSQRFYPYSSILEVNCYAILSLAILGRLDEINPQYSADFIHSCYNPETSGFIGQPYSPSLHPNFRISAMDNTYYAIIALDVLGDDWSAYSSEQVELIAYIKGLQSEHPWEWYFGGFHNDNDTQFGSLQMFEPNLLSCYYGIKSLEYFGQQDTIAQSDFHQYMNGIYHEQGNYFDMAYFNPPTNNTNIIATALGLQLTDLTNNFNVERAGIVDFILQNKNDWGMWDSSTSFGFHELMDTFQVIRALYECGGINQLNSNEKEQIANNLLKYYYQYNHGFSLLSQDYTTIELLNTIVNAFSLFNRLPELDISYIYNYITDSYHYSQYSTYDERHFYACKDIYQTNGQVGSIAGFRSYPIEFYTRSNKSYFHEIEYYHSLKSTFLALEALQKMQKLSTFNESNDLELLLNDIVECQFLDPAYENYGGFMSNVWYKELSKDIQTKNVFLPYAYYGIRNLELLAGFLGLNNISDTGIDTDALYSYISDHLVEEPAFVYCNPKYSHEVEVILENSYYMIYMLKALNLYSLDDSKIRNFVLQHVNYSNIKNVYYSYKILQIVGGDIDLNADLIYMLMEEIYSASFHEYYMTTEKKEIVQEILIWICDILCHGFGDSATVINIEHLENYKFMSTGNNITFSINSTYGGTYWIWVNNSLLDSDSFIYGQNLFSYSLDNYTDYLGDYLVKINATTLDGKYAETMASFSVYSASSTVVNIIDLNSYEFMTTGNNISFQINCQYPDRYNFSIDGIEVTSGPYFDGQIFNFSIDSYFVGIHNVSIWAMGLDGKEGTAHASFTVYSTSETLIQVYSIENYIFDTTGHNVNFSISSSYPDTYQLYIDCVRVAKDTYISGESINFPIDGYGVGTHMVTIWANGSDGKETEYNLEFHVFADSFIYIDVVDLPNYEFKTVGHNITFMINASFPDTFTFSINNMVKYTGSYQFGGDQFSFSIDNYPIGEYNITIWANDTIGKESELTSSFTVYSLSNTVVNIEELADYEFLTTGNFINFSISSFYPHYYTLYIDSVLQLNRSYEDGIPYSFPIDGYGLGYHTVFIWAIGEDGKIGTASGDFYVYSNSSTIINIYEIPNYLFMTTGHYINFSISSKYIGAYNISVDGILEKNGTYAPDEIIMLSSDNYTIGVHTVQIYAKCIDGKQAYYQTTFNVFSNSSTLISLFNLTGFEFMSTRALINFTICSDYPDFFELWIDDILIYTDNYTSGTSIIYPLDNYTYTLGNHSVYIWAIGKDFVVGSINAVFTVYSTSVTIVQINELNNCKFMSEGNNLTFTIFSDYPDFFELWIDDILIYTDNYTSGTSIIYPLDNYTYTLGNHSLYIWAIGKDFVVGSINAVFTVYSTSVTLIQINNLNNCEFMSEGNNLTFTLFSDYPDYYELWIDGFLVQSDTFSNEVPIVYSLDNYTGQIGTHSVFIWAISLDGKIAAISANFEVKFQSETLITIIELENYVYNTTGNNLVFIIVSFYPDHFQVWIDGRLFTSDIFSNRQIFNFSIDGYGIGLHNISIWAKGLDNKEARVTSQFEVYPCKQPSKDNNSQKNDSTEENDTEPSFEHIYQTSLPIMITLITVPSIVIVFSSRIPRKLKRKIMGTTSKQ